MGSSMIAGWMKLLVVALALAAGIASCGDGGGDDDVECHTCTVNEDCDGDQECVLAVDDRLRCFEPDRTQCTLDRVTVGRAPTPVPTVTP